MTQNAANMDIEDELESDEFDEVTHMSPFNCCAPDIHEANREQREDFPDPGLILQNSRVNPSSPINPGSNADEDETVVPEKLFYPFPDEKFFLLYCYSHGIMRPKVSAD